MHRALRISELVELICSQIPNANTVSEPARREDLAALARTATIFHNPALDRLWSYQTTLAPILQCMPVDLWDEQVEKGLLDELELTRPITPADWERPLLYLHRVKELDISENGQLPSREILEALSMSQPRERLLPNLRSLTWAYSDHSYFPSIHTLLGPRITTLHIDLTSHAVSHQSLENATTIMSHLSLIPAIAIKCPCLRFVDFFCDTIPSDFLPHLRTSISLFVRGLKHVETLRVQVLDASALEHLATLSTLRRFRLEDPEVLTSSLVPRLPDTPRFPGLTRLDIHPSTLKVANSFINSLSLSQLTHLIIGVVCIPTLYEISSLYHTITQNLPRAQLRTLEIAIIDENHAPLPDAWMAKHAALRQLFCFQNLTVLMVQIPGGFDLDDACVLNLARAWPSLETLGLSPMAGRSDRRVTLTALHVLANHCPELKYLAIELTGLAIPPLEVDADQHVIQSTLETLHVGDSPISDPVAVASYISRIFSGLTNIYGDQRWNIVAETIAQRRRLLS
ncbi:hypothetical protein B0H19DRAFT_1088166 [Mycena capillaripes]|nr:hypothetical protein B0H19DRAFT_1088166 [Mycena capillaripes]